MLWNPIRVLDIPCSGTRGAPQGGDPRLCCVTRTGLNRRIPRVGFFIVHLAAKVRSLLSFLRQHSMHAALCERLAKVYGPDGCKRALQGSSRRSEKATVLISEPLGRITSNDLNPWLNDRGFDQPQQTVGHFFFGAFEEGDGFGFR